MKLLVGLGNPGREHENNRHNIGYRLVQAYVANRAEANTAAPQGLGARLLQLFGGGAQDRIWQQKSQFNGFYAKFQVKGNDVVALLPTTYMNRSGDAVRPVAQFFKVALEDIIVLHDELDIPAGSVRIKRGGGAGGHNGLKSIDPMGVNYLRIRLGIGRPPNPRMDVVDHVLGDFTPEEQRLWEEKFPDVAKILDLCIAGKDREVMNRYNRRDKGKA